MSFKALIVSVFSSTLLLFSGGVWAQDGLLDTNPSFYLLQDEGETFKVHACRGNYDENVLSSVAQGRNPLGTECSSTVVVSGEDLHRFVIKLALELESLDYYGVNQYELESKDSLGALGISSGITALIFGTFKIETIVQHEFILRIEKHSLRPQNIRRVVIAGLISVLGIGGGAILFRDSAEKKEYVRIRNYLHQGLLNGVVREEGHAYDAQVMEMFANFLSEYGTPVNS